MCGIAAIYSYRPVAPEIDPKELVAIRDHMRNRGPDGKGLWISENKHVGLAHRRLSIIDLTHKADQPMTIGQVSIAFNGEIYNHQELRDKLKKKGVIFTSLSDTEVLIHLYLVYGEAMLEKLRGMFAFVIWDERKKAMFLVRDPYGIKPLYYANDGWSVRIASQVKALLAGGKVSSLPEPAGIVGFYLMGSVPEPYTCYQEIRALPAGHSIWIDESGMSSEKEYFSISKIFASAEQAPFSLDQVAANEEVRAALLETIQHHCIADVPVGAFLSSGIDSSAIVALAKESGYDQLETLTLGFSEYAGKKQDETPLATEIAAFYKTQHTTRVLNSKEFYSDISVVLESMDQPSIDGINTYFVSKAASELGWKVALSGVGADELFGGYPSFGSIPKWVRSMAIPSRVPGLGHIFRLLVSSVMSSYPPKASGLVTYGGSYAGAYLLKRGLFLPEELPAIIGNDIAQTGLERLKPLHWIGQNLHSRSRASFSKVAALEASVYMRNQLLRDSDWAGMAHSLEIRTPFVDAHLLKKLAPILVSKFRSHGKAILTMAPKNILPNHIRKRPKTGFTVPVDRWLQQDKKLDAWRKYPMLKRDKCPWARRWSVIVAEKVLV